MFCPKCGSNQGEGKKFCTVCGTNLGIVSQALTGRLAQPPVVYHPPQITNYEIERQAQMRKGITMAVLGGGYLVYKIISSIFLAPISGWRSPFGTLSFIAFIVFAIGIAKIVSSRVTNADTPATSNTDHAHLRTSAASQSSLHLRNEAQLVMPQPVFSAASTVEQTVPNTGELEPVHRPAVSVTEDDTRHLPG